MLYTYIGVIVFFVLWNASDALNADLQTRWIGALLDPSGGNAVSQHIRSGPATSSTRSCRR
jgi:hypothetical protein